VIATELRRGHEDAFVVRTDEPDLQAVLPALAYPEEADQEFVRRFRPSDLTPTSYERFSACVSTLLAQTARREFPPWESSLENLHHVLATAGVDWMLGGALRSRYAVCRSSRATSTSPSPTTKRPSTRSVISSSNRRSRRTDSGLRSGSRARGTARGSSGQPRRADLDDHEWTSDIGPEAERRAEIVSWRGLDFRVPPLDLQAAVTRERGLHDRATAIDALS
jgi:hypothetical protein